MRYVVVLLLLAIPLTLASALFALMKDRGQGERVVRALSWRIALSLLLFFLIVLIYRLGWVSGHLFR